MGALPENEIRNTAIIRLRKAGMLPREIALTLGISKNVVIGVTNRAGLAVPGLQNKCALRGKDHPRNKAKLSDKDIKAIRSQYIPRHREFGQLALAKAYGVTQPAISAIVTRRTWSHVDD